jgi:hypothetical protein
MTTPGKFRSGQAAFFCLVFGPPAINSTSLRSNRINRMKAADPYIHILQANNSQRASNRYGCRKEPMSRDLKRASARISLVILALGFSLLGILSYIHRLQGELGMESAVDQNCCVAGSVGSLFAGAVFLAACLCWRW